jgi:ATP-dependent RNA helicase DDX19/DBP5
MKFLRDSFDVACIFGSPMRVEEREKIMEKFQENKIKILITTNLLSRGIDLRRVKLVINADLPIKMENDSLRPDPDTYLHRIGRTGRFGDIGIALNLIDGDRSRNNFKVIKENFKIEEKDVKKLENITDLKPLLEKMGKMNDEKRKNNDEDTFD